MKRLYYLLILFLNFFALLNISYSYADETVTVERPNNQINIIHINDINGNLQPVDYIKDEDFAGKIIGGFPRVAAFSREFREKMPFTLFISGGDVLGPTPYSARSKGKVVIDMFNLAKLDVWSPGTYDFLYGLEELNKRISEARFAVVNSNIFIKKTGKNWIKPYIILEKNKKKIAILGVTPLGFFTSMSKDIRESLEVKDAMEVVKPLAQELKKEVDLVILIAQLDNGEKSQILAKTDVDFIVGSIGSASEANLTSLSIPNGKFAVSTQGNCWSVGQVTVQWNEDKTIEYKNLKQNILELEKYPQGVLEKTVPDILDKMESYNKEKPVIISHFSKDPNKDESYEFVGNVIRQFTKSDITILNKNFFLRDSNLAKDITKENIYTMVHLPFRIAKVNVSGSELKAFLNNHDLESMVLTGIEDNKINGFTINDTEKYGISTDESFYRSQPFLKDRNVVYSDKNINDIVYSFVENYKNNIIDLEQFNEYGLWKSSFNVDIDPQLLNLNLPKDGQYTYLTWKGDQNATRWGGLFSGYLRKYWGKNKLDNNVEFELRQQQTGEKPIEKYSDRIKFENTYTREFFPNIVQGFTNLKISSFFINPDPKKPHSLISEFSAGLSHTLPLGFRLREGLEVRKDVFDPATKWNLGTILGLGMDNNIFFLKESFDAKIYIPADFNAFVTEIENRVTIPIGSFASVFYKTNLYNESLDFKYWAVRHNIGVAFKFDVPLSF